MASDEEEIRIDQPPIPSPRLPYAQRAYVSRPRPCIVVAQPSQGPELSVAEVQLALDRYMMSRRRVPESSAPDATIDTRTVAAFQEECCTTMTYPMAGNGLIYPLLGLIGEVGEAMEAVQTAVLQGEASYVSALHTPVIAMMALLGEIAEVIKKGYRNIDYATGMSGVLATEAIDRIFVAMNAMIGMQEELKDSLQAWNIGTDRIILPPVVLSPDERERFGREMGDAVWYWNVALYEAGLRAGTVAHDLMAKLRSREALGTLRSTGDDETTRRPGAD